MNSENEEDREELDTNLRIADAAAGEKGKTLHAALEKEEALKTIINHSQAVVFLWKKRT
jgi:hypothetical protein